MAAIVEILREENFDIQTTNCGINVDSIYVELSDSAGSILLFRNSIALFYTNGSGLGVLAAEMFIEDPECFTQLVKHLKSLNYPDAYGELCQRRKVKAC